MVRDLIYRLICYAIVVAIIIGGFKVYKHQSGLKLAADDRSMDPDKFPPGNYKVDTSYAKPSQLQPGNIIAYFEPRQPNVHRMGRVVAIEGQRVSVQKDVVTVDGKKLNMAADSSLRFPEFRVPRGCVYVIADNSSVGADSLQVGPIPFYCVMGRVE